MYGSKQSEFIKQLAPSDQRISQVILKPKISTQIGVLGFNVIVLKL